MEHHNSSFGRSASMPLLSHLQQYPAQRHQNEWERAYEHSQPPVQNSPGLQDFRRSSASTFWVPDHTQVSSATLSPDGVRYDQDGASSRDSLSGAPTPQQEISYENMEGSSPTALTSSSPDSEATIVPGTDLDERSGIIPIALDRSLANTTVLNHLTQHQAQPANMHYPPSQWNLNVPVDDMKSHSRAPSEADSAVTFVTDYSHTLSVGSEDSNGCTSSPKSYLHLVRKLRTPTPSKVTNRVCSLQDLHVPGQTLHRRRMSSRVSSLPAIPSPLGLGRVRKAEMESDVSGLVSPVLGSGGGQKDDEGMKSPLIFGMHAKQSATDGRGGLFPAAMDQGFGHSRKHTDPFIDSTAANTWAYNTGNLPTPSPRVAQPPKHFSWASPSSAGTPATLTFKASTPPSTAATAVNTTPRPPSLPPLFTSFVPPPTRSSPLPIPPPPLSSIQGPHTHTPAARARLDAQIPVRETWIRTEAKKIVALKQHEIAAAQQYLHTQSKEDYEAWQCADAALKDATNVEKRMEERRNLFMPVGMKAMRTNVAGDGTMEWGGMNGGGDGQGQGEGRLLGYRMAVMERVCAEVKRRDEEDDDDGGISREMLATLSLAEKKALREHLVARLEKGRERRG